MAGRAKRLRPAPSLAKRAIKLALDEAEKSGAFNCQLREYAQPRDNRGDGNLHDALEFWESVNADNG